MQNRTEWDRCRAIEEFRQRLEESLLLTAVTFHDTAAVCRRTSQGCIHYSRGTTYARFHTYRFGRTVQSTGTTFHAGIAVHNFCSAIQHTEYSMWTDYLAHATPVAHLCIKRQCYYITQIDEITHLHSSLRRNSGNYPEDKADCCTTYLQWHCHPHLLLHTG